MATAIRTIGHEDRLSLVDHLDELRTRLLVCGAVLAVAFAVCLWQNHVLLEIMNRPLVQQTRKQVAQGHGPLGQTAITQQGLLALAHSTEALARSLSAPDSHLPAATRAALSAEIPQIKAATAKIPKVPKGDLPVTLGFGEPFTATLTVSLYFALVISLPVILFELYGFLLPAFSPRERRVVTPLLTAIPFLFVLGVLFGYFVVLPAAVRFFQNFNSEQFNVLVQVSQYYKFAATTLLAMGLVFQVPVAILAAVRGGIVSPRQLRRGRRYAFLACAGVAAFLPGDLTTLILETIPLYVLYEISILLASLMTRRAAAREREEELAAAAASNGVGRSGDDTAGMAGAGRSHEDTTTETAGARRLQNNTTDLQDDTSEQSVQTIIDHTDPELSD
jgi:sec-independent protein translocase protein TatC